MCLKRLTLLWGPPGSGKTRTLSLCIAYLAARMEKGNVILVTASTNAALNQLEKYMKELQAQDLRLQELISVVRVEGQIKRSEMTAGKNVNIWIGTVWSLSKDNRLSSSDNTRCIVVDEASQMPPADLSMIMNNLKPNGRLIVAGDFLQLTPVLRFNVEEIPKLPSTVLNPCKSLMECLLRTKQNEFIDPLATFDFSNAQNVVSLTDNWRMTKDLCEFTQKRYGLQFVSKAPVHLKYAQTNKQSRFGVCLGTAVAGSGRMSVIVDPKTKNVSDVSHEAQLNYEATVVCQLIEEVMANVKINEGTPRSIFVVTPHRTQRACITNATERLNVLYTNANETEVENLITIDTVERMQGREADVVIVCYSFLNIAQVQSELAFLFHPNRINVALSRAKAVVILIASSSVVSPSLSVLGSPIIMRGFQFLNEFIEGSVSCVMNVVVDGVGRVINEST